MNKEIINFLFLLHRPIYGFQSNISKDISYEDKVYYLKSWILGDIVVAIVFYFLGFLF